jgi:two-component system nitrate/nitrite response regulator NarL
MDILWQAGTLASAAELIRVQPPSLVVVDKSFGIHNVLEWLAGMRVEAPQTQVVVWGVSLAEAEALRFLQVGAKGIVRKSCDLLTVLTCLRAVATGSSWMDDGVFRETPRPQQQARSDLTPRERQVLDLVEQGMKNKEIARELGIRPGTVKIHLKHIFEKTGVRGRYGLALSVIRERSTLELAS